MEDHASPHDVADREPIGDEGTEGVSVDAEQRRHIPGVVGMGAAKGIVVHAYVGEGVLFIAGAGTALVDVEGENGALAGGCGVGRPITSVMTSTPRPCS